MSITDELRKEARGLGGYVYTGEQAEHLTAIADRIDAEHERQLGVLYRDMSDAEWVRLPKDADGKHIHIGDVMEERSGHTFEVASLMAFGGSENWLVLSDPRNFSSFREPHDIRHHHAPTVEDVLTEFGIDWEHESDCEDRAALLREYATKLQLKEDA